MDRLQLSLLKGGWISINPSSNSNDGFRRIVDSLKIIPVIRYDKKSKCNIISIHYLDKLYSIAGKKGYELYITDNLEDYHKRFKIKCRKIKQERNNTKFSSTFWTSDPECKIADYQAKAINTIYRARRFLLGDDMGVGKTPTSIGVMCKAFENEDCDRALVVCLNDNKHQWKSEIIKFTIFKEEDISIIDLKVKDFKCPLGITNTLDLRSKPCKICEKKENCKERRDDPDYRIREQMKKGKIVIIHYEALDRMKDFIIKCGFGVFIFDEATEIKNWSADVTKAAAKITNAADTSAIVLPMSGTFIENRIDELYGPFTVADKRIFGESFNFKNNYLVFDYFGNVIGEKNEKKLKKIIDKWIIRRTIDEVWKDRPELIEITKSLEMGEEQRKFYDDAKSGILKDIEDKGIERKVNMADIGPLLNYLIQISDTPEAIDSTVKESIKMETLKHLIKKEISRLHKVIIFSFFGNKVIPIIEREIKALDVGSSVVVTGKVDKAIAEKRKERFRNDPDCRFLICSDSLSKGGNFQNARYVINFDLPWNPATLDQRIRRAYRRGQQHTVTVINLVTQNSVEDGILEKIGNKRKLFDQFLGSAKKTRNISVSDMLDILRR